MMKQIIAEVSRQTGISEGSFQKGLNHDIYVVIPEEKFRDTTRELSRDFNLVSLFAAENFSSQGFTLFYAFEKKEFNEILVVVRHLTGKQATSVARRFASACWYEREISDGFGIEFPNAFDKRRLFLHEVYPTDFHPLLKSFANQPIVTKTAVTPQEEYQFNRLEGEGVYQIPVGPVHAGIIEPGHFRFSVIGETIFNLEIRMFYKHRGIEKLAEGKAPAECLPIAESISGDETAANAAAYCIAVEQISKTEVPVRAWQLRTILLELERIYSHLGDLAGMLTDVAYPVGASRFLVLREEILRQNSTLTGSRFLKNIFCIGGLKRDISPASLDGLTTYLKTFPGNLKEALHLMHKSIWVIDRLETSGIIKKELVNPLHLTGPVARASGVDTDTRIDHPYGIYPELQIQKRLLEKGDVMSRFEVKAAEIMYSIELINSLLTSLQAGEISVPVKITDGHTLVLVESPRGQSMHWICIKNGLVERYKVRTASFCNWRAIEHAVIGNIVPDFPLINKSLNLSYAGTDL